jgi:hypothetical protein
MTGMGQKAALSTPAENCTFLAVENCTLGVRGDPQCAGISFFLRRKTVSEAVESAPGREATRRSACSRMR